MIGIEIGERNHLLYLLLPHRLKERLLSPSSRAKLDHIDQVFNQDARVRISAYWIPCSRRLVSDPMRRFRLETAVGRAPGLRHWASVLAVEAARSNR